MSFSLHLIKKTKPNVSYAIIDLNIITDNASTKRLYVGSREETKLYNGEQWYISTLIPKLERRRIFSRGSTVTIPFYFPIFLLLIISAIMKVTCYY